MTTAPSTIDEPRASELLLQAQAAAFDFEALRRRAAWLRLWPFGVLALDLTMLVVAWFASDFGAGAAHVTPLDRAWTLAFLVGGIAILASRGMYRLGLWTKPLEDLGRILYAFVLSGMTVVAMRVFLTGDAATANAALRQVALAVVYVGAGRTALYWSLANAHARGDLVRRALVVGAGRVGGTIAQRLLSCPELGLRPVAFLDDDPVDTDELELPVVGGVSDIEHAVGQTRADHVIVAFSPASDDELLDLVQRCEQLGVRVSVVPRLFEKVPERIEVDHLGGIALLTPRPTDPLGWEFTVKYALDRVLAGLILVAVSPMLVVCTVAVRLSIGRPIFFRQRRVGRDGKPFEILKFRSMRDALPEELAAMKRASLNGNAPGGVEGVDRRTRVGTILRKTSLDELPQLLNVLKGEMSLVGPRPERPEYVEQFEHDVYRYGERHRCKSGITGWAQVHGLRGKTSIADRAEWDNHYIESFSLRLDLKILLMTLGALVSAFRDVE